MFVSGIIPDNNKEKLSNLEDFKIKIYEILPHLPDNEEIMR